MRGRLAALLTFWLLWLLPAQPCLADELLAVRLRAYGGVVTKLMAERAALLEAELAAYDVAVRRLAELPELRFVGGIGENLPDYVPDPDALARAVFSREVVSRDICGGKAGKKVRVAVKVVGVDAGMRKKVVQGLREKGLLELYAMAIPRQRQLLELYDRASAGLLGRNAAGAGKGRPVESRVRLEGIKLARICDEMAALDMFAKQLDGFSDTFKHPEEAMRSLQRASELAPENALILAGFGEACLLMDRADLAEGAVEKALALAPDFARAHDLKGILLLRSQLPALASSSFKRAVELSPANADYLVHRGSAYLVQEEAAKACDDFRQACVLGDCSEYEWAMGNGLCASSAEAMDGGGRAN